MHWPFFLVHLEDYAFLLLGVILGLLYFLDGWRGDKDKDMKDMLRVRNFSWVIGGAGISFVTGFILREKGTEDPLVICNLVHYLIGFVGMLVPALIFGGIAVGVKFRRIHKKEPHKYPSGFFMPVMDYYYYGYGWLANNYKQCLGEFEKERIFIGEAKKREDFFFQYSHSISTCMATVEVYKNDPTRGNKEKIIETLLQSICLVMQLHYRMTTDNTISTNSNVMLLKKREDFVDDELKTKVKFFNGDSKVDHFLELSNYAFYDGREDFIIPVGYKVDGGWNREFLPGAPTAIVKSKLVIIDNTHSIDYNDCISEEIKRSMTEYFRGKQFQSFVSQKIVRPDGTVAGVLNVESNISGIFCSAEQPGQANERTFLIHPFVCLLGSIL